MPKISFKNLSKSQRNKRLREYLSKSNNFLDASVSTSRTSYEIGESSSGRVQGDEFDDDDDNSNFITDDSDASDINDNSDDSKSNDGEISDSFDNQSDEQASDDTNLCLSAKLAKWVSDYNISRDATQKLLNILNTSRQEEMNHLPLDPRTLLRTPEAPIETRKVPPGEYFHYRLEKALIDQLRLFDYHVMPNFIVINVNIDGLPIAKSSTSQLYPVLAQIHPAVSQPFVIGIYHGYEKPKSCKLFLQEFLDEYQILNTNGFIYKNREFKVKIRAVICDSPARSFVTCTKSHNGYYGCGKCREEGDYKDHRMLFLNINAALRTDQNFIDRIDEDHHTGESPFEEAGIGMVSQFPLDYMHNCCLGVMKKILTTFVKGPHKQKWSAKQIIEISERLVKIAKWIPQDFARKPRQLQYVERFKATEFRQFLLYTGPVVFENYLPQIYQTHFIALHCAIRILSHEEDCLSNNDYARSLLQYFVENCKTLYGEKILVYNFHNLIHLPDDVLKFGHLDSFSAFPFESYLYTLKKKLKKAGQPLQQLYRRIVEQNLNSASSKIKIFKQPFVLDKNEEISKKFNIPSYNTVQYKGFKLSIKSNGDKFCYLQNDSIIRVENIRLSDGKVTLTGAILLNATSFPNYPVSSLQLKIYVGNTWSQPTLFNAEDVKMKAVCIPYGDDFCFLPLIHSCI